MTWLRNGGGVFESGRDALTGASLAALEALEALLDLDLRDFEEEVMAARRSGKGGKGVCFDSAGGHRVDDRVIHHHAAHGGEDVATDQGTVFIETVAAEAPLFNSRAVTE